MTGEKDNKKSIKDKLMDIVLPQAWLQIKNQLAEEMKAQGAENVKIENLNLNVNINLGDTNYKGPVNFPPDTNVKSVVHILDKMAPRPTPQIGDIRFDNLDRDLISTIDTAVNSSATTLSTMAAITSVPIGKSEDEN